jgi:hypothetical protein
VEGIPKHTNEPEDTRRVLRDPRGMIEYAKA